ncbi:MAG: alpha-1,2-fucosyltransferase [Bacteroidaceae bacterium]|nr:alpha-1,2-fucosyltransferase [Bacteroidaceae bacterium]
MISAYISGRLGNQLFQYAYVRALRYYRGDKDTLAFNFDMIEGSNEEFFVNSLSQFSTLPFSEAHGNLILNSGSMLQKCAFGVYKIYERAAAHCSWLRKQRAGVCSWLNKFGIVFQPSQQDSAYIDIRPAQENVMVYGKFENPAYLRDIRPILLEEFAPRQPLLPANEELLRVIQESNSVCISIRRGDYLAKEFVDDFFVCGKDYYERAIEVIRSKVDNPTFIFFSNDIQWVKANIHVDAPCYYESGTDPNWETLRLMSACKHFIISNSTFHWWAQFLCRHENKIVISPDRWYNNPNWGAYLLTDSFIQLNTRPTA